MGEIILPFSSFYSEPRQKVFTLTRSLLWRGQGIWAAQDVFEMFQKRYRSNRQELELVSLDRLKVKCLKNVNLEDFR